MRRLVVSVVASDVQCSDVAFESATGEFAAVKLALLGSWVSTRATIGLAVPHKRSVARPLEPKLRCAMAIAPVPGEGSLPSH